VTCITLSAALVLFGAASGVNAETAAAYNAEAHALERSDPAAALEAAGRAATLAGTGDPVAAAEAALHRSHALRLLGRYGEALSAGEAARQGADAAGDERTAGRAAANLAVLYETGGLDAEALALHRRALLLFERQGWKEATASTLLNLGNLFERRGELAEAAAAFRRALLIKREIDAPGQGAALSSLATVAFARERYEEAVQLLQEAVVAQQREQDAAGEAVSWRNLAASLLELGRAEQAREAIDKAGRLAAQSGNVLVRAAVAEGRAELLAAAPAPNDALREALAANAEALALAAEAEPSRRARLQRQRASLAEQAGDPATALVALREAEALEDQGRRDEGDRRYAVLAGYFDSEKQRLNIAALNDRATADAAELASQRLLRNSLLAGSTLLAAIALLLYARIRQRHGAERELAAHNRQLEAALAAADRERVHAREAERVNRELLRVAAEDLRVPLTSALGSAERLLMLGADQPTLRRDAAAIADTLQHLVHLVTDLVESAELERHDARLARQPLDLAQVLRGVCAHYGLRASEKRQLLECDAPERVPLVGDPARLREALEHLVGNALKFTPAGKRIDATLQEERGHAVVRVRDQGPGLREQDRERAFGKLQRAGNRPTGNEHSAGLGLWLVRRIAELHGGDVTVVSAPGGEGSEFVLRIPLQPA
jgi:signal transduction histidine kinase